MKFYEALKMCVEEGKRISRTDWNGRGMYIYYSRPKRVEILPGTSIGNGDDTFTEQEKAHGYVDISGHFDMMNAQGIRIIGWLASQTDMASDNWVIVE